MNSRIRKKINTKSILTFFILCLFAGILAGCNGPSSKTQAFTRTDFVMDTVLGEKIYGSQDLTADLQKVLSDLE